MLDGSRDLTEIDCKIYNFPTFGNVLAEVILQGEVIKSSVMVFGGKVPAWIEAFVNGGMSHGLDYDDIHHTSR